MSSVTLPEDGTYTTDVAAMFAQVFDVPTVGPNDDFFQMGGDSLMAESLILEIERRFGVIISIAALLESPTPRQLADVVTRTMANLPGRCLVPVAVSGRGTPIFCVHGMGGAPGYARKLASGTDRPIYGFRAEGLLAGELPRPNIAQMAKGYLREVRTVQPRGPYLLFGQCGAAMIAYEMAQQLVGEGETVAGLILADPTHKDQLLNDFTPWLTTSGEALARTQKKFANQIAQALIAAAASAKLTGEDRWQLVRRVVRMAIAAYSPKPYSGPLLLLCSNERRDLILNPERGLPTLAPALEVATIDADHIALFSSDESLTAIREFVDQMAPV